MRRDSRQFDATEMTYNTWSETGRHVDHDMTPIADSAIAKVSFPPRETCQWLRGCEMRIRQLLRTAHTLHQAGNTTHRLADTTNELEEFTSNSESSPFLRALRRPFRQLEMNSVVRRSVAEAIARLEVRMNELEAVHPLLMELIGKANSVQEKFATTLPGLTKLHLNQKGLNTLAIAEIRSVNQAERALRRMSAVERALENHRMNLPDTPQTLNDLDKLIGSGIALSIAELESLYNRKVRAHSARTQRSSVFMELAELRRQHFVSLAKRRPLTYQTSIAASAIENLVATAADVAASANTVNGIGLLDGALAALSEANREFPVRFRWTPPAGLLYRSETASVRQEVKPGMDGSLYAIHLGGGHFCVTSEQRSLVKVYSAAIEIGGTIECQVVFPQEFVDLEHARNEVAPLFDGLDESVTKWQRMTKRARLTVTTIGERKWFAEVKQKGIISAVKGRTAAGSFQVATSLKSHRKNSYRRNGLNPEVLPVVPFGDTITRHGISSSSVHTRITDCAEARLRFLTSDSFSLDADSFRRLHNETTLFQNLQLKMRADSMAETIKFAEYIGVGKIEQVSHLFPLYSRTNSLSLSAPGVEDWLRETWQSKLHALRGFARIILAAHRSEFALGSCAIDSYEWDISWHRQTGNPMPEPVLIAAPHAMPFGERATFLESDLSERLPRTRIPLRPRATLNGDSASALIDGEVFAGLLLEVLALEPNASRPLRRSWQELFALAANNSKDHFSEPILARAVGVVMHRESGASDLLRFVSDVAVSTDPTPLELARLLVAQEAQNSQHD